jgi:hypothetical protein
MPSPAIASATVLIRSLPTFEADLFRLFQPMGSRDKGVSFGLSQSTAGAENHIEQRQ